MVEWTSCLLVCKQLISKQYESRDIQPGAPAIDELSRALDRGRVEAETGVITVIQSPTSFSRTCVTPQTQERRTVNSNTVGGGGRAGRGFDLFDI